MAGFQNAESALEPLFGELRDRELENTFRDFDFERVKRGVVTFVVIATVGLLFFTVVETAYAPLDSVRVDLLVGRAVLLALIVGASVVLLRIQSRILFNRIALSAVTLLPLSAAVITILRPATSQYNFMFDVVLVLSYYLFFHFPLRIVVVPPLLITAVQLFLLFTFKEMESVYDTHVVTTALVVANIVGILASRQGSMENRLRFLNFRREADSRAHLEATLKRLELLEGLVPICAHCKRIRKDDGGWEQVEAFVARGTNLTFSHGICPECTREHFSDFADQ